MKVTITMSAFAAVTAFTTQEIPCWNDLDCMGSMFCGTDKVCHSYNCREWYAFGDPTTTGRLKTNSDDGTVVSSSSVIDPKKEKSSVPSEIDMKCVRVEDTAAKFGPWATVFSCEDYVVPQGEFYSNIITGLPFNTKCSAKTETGDIFNCYEINIDRDEEDAYYHDFLARAEDISPLDCETRFQPLQIRNAKPAFSSLIYNGLGESKENDFHLKILQNETFDPRLPRTVALRTELVSGQVTLEGMYSTSQEAIVQAEEQARQKEKASQEAKTDNDAEFLASNADSATTKTMVVVGLFASLLLKA